MAFTLPDLPYPHDALEPSIDARTMEIHHGKHHQAYVTKLNDAISGHGDIEGRTIEGICSDLASVPEKIRTAVRNNGGGHFNHSLFWTVMGPNASDGPTGELAAAIDSTFGSLDDLKKAFGNAAATRFGSGWAWLLVRDGKLAVDSTANQDNPLMGQSIPGIDPGIPILGLDVWEHAYYLNYQNRRPDYISAWWNVVNWSAVADRFAAASVATV